MASHYLLNSNTSSCGCLQHETQVKNGQKNLKDLTGQKFGKLTVIKLLDERGAQGHTYWLCQCDCGNLHVVRGSHLIEHNITSCGCINYSIGEQNIVKILKQNNIAYEKEKTFNNFIFEDTFGCPRYDFYLPEFNRLIEFDGRQHFEDTSFFDTTNLIKHDKAKNEFALKNHIELVRIPYWERDLITLEMILGEQYLIKE